MVLQVLALTHADGTKDLVEPEDLRTTTPPDAFTRLALAWDLGHGLTRLVSLKFDQTPLCLGAA